MLQSTLRNVHDPRALAVILEKAEAYLAERNHPDRYIREWKTTTYYSSDSHHTSTAAMMPDGTKW